MAVFFFCNTTNRETSAIAGGNLYDFFHFLKRFFTFSIHRFIPSLSMISLRVFSSLKAFSSSLFVGHFSILQKKSSILLLSSGSHARLVELSVEAMVYVLAASNHSRVSCCLSLTAICSTSTRGSLMSTALMAWQCLTRSATFTSIPVISSNGLSCTVFLIPFLTSCISTLSALPIKS